MEDSKIFEIFKMDDGDIERLVKELDEEEKLELIKFLVMFSRKMNQLYISYIKTSDNVIETQDISIKQSEIMIENLLSRLEKSKLKIYKKNDIMELLSCESDKALRFLKLATQTGFATKVGKDYQITKENVEKFLKQYEGKTLII